MKAILLLAVLAMAGSAFGGPLFGDSPDAVTKMVKENYPAPASHSTIFAAAPPNEQACKPSKVDYTIVTLPDGKTARRQDGNSVDFPLGFSSGVGAI
jgi:hypothetical protein